MGPAVVRALEQRLEQSGLLSDSWRGVVATGEKGLGFKVRWD